MSVAGIQAVQLLMLLDEKGLFSTTFSPGCTKKERLLGECFEAVCKTMVIVARKTVRADTHTDYVELHKSQTPTWTENHLFPWDSRDNPGLSRDLISLKIPERMSHTCDKSEHQDLIEIFGHDGWLLRGIVIEVVDFRGPNLRVRLHLMLADRMWSPRLTTSVPGQREVASYVYLTLLSTGKAVCERFDIRCDVETLRSVGMGRSASSEAFRRPLSKQLTGDLDDVLGRGAEAQFFKDLPKLEAFLRLFAADNSRD